MGRSGAKPRRDTRRTIASPTAQLPDCHALGRCEVHAIARADAERGVERLEVHQRRDRADRRRRVLVALEDADEFALAVVAAAALRPSDEEALVAGEAVDHRRFAAAERQAV